MKMAKIEGGVVINVAEFDVPISDWASDWVEVTGGAGIGWTYDGATFLEPAPDLVAERSAARLTRQAFAQKAAEAGFVTYAEAADYTTGKALPTSVEAVISAQPSADQDRIRFEVLTETEIKRNGVLMPGLIAAFGTDDAGLDALFGIG